MRELICLLENRWVIRERDKDLYYEVKDNIKLFKDFIKEKLGYQIIVTSDFIKMEKIPGQVEPWMGIEEFDSKIEYLLICVILMFLEDKEKGEQFVLSQLTDYIQTRWIDNDNPIDWTKYDLRKKFIKVLKFCLSNYLIKNNDGDEMLFADNLSTEVLYENTGMSKYLVNRFWNDISEFSSYKDFEDNEYNRFEEDKGVIRKNRVYRSLIMSLVVYKYDGYENDLIYIKNYRNMLEGDISKFFDSDLHIHKNCAMIMMKNSNYRDVFPNTRNISDIILQIGYFIRCELLSKYDSENISKIAVDGKLDISLENFKDIIKKCRDLNWEGWGKNFREMTLEKLYNEILNEMVHYRMIIVDNKNERVYILPLATKFSGKYPNDYKKIGE